MEIFNSHSNRRNRSYLATFLELMMGCRFKMANLKKLSLDAPTCPDTSQLPNTIVNLMTRLPAPSKITEITLHMNWAVISNPDLLFTIASLFPNLTTLSLMGTTTPETVNGIDGKTISLFAASFRGKLERLTIKSFGLGSFSNKCFNFLIERQVLISHTY